MVTEIKEYFCSYCSEKIERHLKPSEIKRSKKLYCSYKCAHKGNATARKGFHKPKPTTEKLAVCDCCGWNTENLEMEGHTCPICTLVKLVLINRY